MGSRTRVKVVKNKLAPPFREAEFDLLYGHGVSREGELLDLGEKEGLVHKSGAWLSLETERLGQGRDNARKVLLENRPLAERLEAQLRARAGLPAMATREAAKVPQPKDEGAKKAA